MKRYVLIALLLPVSASALDLGIGFGTCDSQGAIDFCSNNGSNWGAHVFMTHDFYVKNNWSFGGEYHHFSRPEKSDLEWEYGTGRFDYIGVYVKYSFGGKQ